MTSHLSERSFRSYMMLGIGVTGFFDLPMEYLTQAHPKNIIGVYPLPPHTPTYNGAGTVRLASYISTAPL